VSASDALRVVGLYGPTGAGKSALAALLARRLGGEVVSADSAALYAGLTLLTAAPAAGTQLVGRVPLDHAVSVGEYQRLAHAAIDGILAAGATPIVAGGTGLYLRAALSNLTLPPPPAAGARARFDALYAQLGPEASHRRLAEADPAAAARVHPNDRRRVVRALELAAQGASLAPAEDRLWSGDMRRPTLLFGLELGGEALEARIRRRLAQMVADGVVAEAQAAWRSPLSPTARRVLGLEQFATLPLELALEETTRATLRLARYQRKWLRRLPVTATLDAERPLEEIADEIMVALAGAREHLPGQRGAARAG
jgi:tRNA dimethylallyltransferase